MLDQIKLEGDTCKVRTKIIENIPQCGCLNTRNVLVFIFIRIFNAYSSNPVTVNNLKSISQGLKLKQKVKYFLTLKAIKIF